jgi:Immunoglobulin-like domain of bacterial spore germination/Sporulation and spore germination
MTRPALPRALGALIACCLLAACGQAGGSNPVETDRRAARTSESARQGIVPSGEPGAGSVATSTNRALPPTTVATGNEGAAPLASAPGSTRDEALPWESGKAVPVTVHFVYRSNGRLYLVPERRRARAAAGAMEAAAMLALSERPTWPGPANPFPGGTRLLGFTLADGTATLNLSSEVLAWDGGPEDASYAVQALVRTLASVGEVARVRIQVEGQAAGLKRGRDLDKLWGGLAITRPAVPDPAMRVAPITLATPRPNSAVTGGRVWVQGEASTAGGTVSLRLRDQDGTVMAQNFTTAEETAPRRGAFSASLPFTAPGKAATWSLEVFETNPADGSTNYQIAIPVTVGG